MSVWASQVLADSGTTFMSSGEGVVKNVKWIGDRLLATIARLPAEPSVNEVVRLTLPA